MLFRLPDAAAVTDNPDPDELKALAARMPNAQPTRFDNLNVQTEVVNRSKGSTFIVTDEPDGQNQAISREEGERWAQRQEEYIADQEMVVVDSRQRSRLPHARWLYIGPPTRTSPAGNSSTSLARRGGLEATSSHAQRRPRLRTAA
jgi:hypothetical protein